MWLGHLRLLLYTLGNTFSMVVKNDYVHARTDPSLEKDLTSTCSIVQYGNLADENIPDNTGICVLYLFVSLHLEIDVDVEDD